MVLVPLAEIDTGDAAAVGEVDAQVTIRSPQEVLEAAAVELIARHLGKERAAHFDAPSDVSVVASGATTCSAGGSGVGRTAGGGPTTVSNRGGFGSRPEPPAIAAFIALSTQAASRCWFLARGLLYINPGKALLN